MITLATAHPAKFPDAVEGATGIRPRLPPRMADLFDRPERVTRVPNDLAGTGKPLSAKGPAVDPPHDTLPNGFRIVTEHMPGLKRRPRRRLGHGGRAA
jgi:hypothetical protein